MRHALQYFMHYGPAAFRFELAGELDTDGALRLERDWLKASSLIGEHALIVDVTFVTSAQAAGRALLARWYAAGARFVAQSKTSRALIEASPDSHSANPLRSPRQAMKPGCRSHLPSLRQVPIFRQPLTAASVCFQ